MTKLLALKWERLVDGAYRSGEFLIKREATTHGMRRASNPMWHVYRDGDPHRVYRRATLNEAKAAVARRVAFESRND